jgi:hypothetical protein
VRLTPEGSTECGPSHGEWSPVADVIKLFTAVSYTFSKKARAFVPGRPFHLSLKFAGKAEAYASESPFMCSTLW